ncbi:hypothetical protein DIPPA_33246 [Diplonema papillatum]|nr:hypothetical protein DIPPA_33246 [Diplonema papillatum]
MAGPLSNRDEHAAAAKANGDDIDDSSGGSSDDEASPKADWLSQHLELFYDILAFLADFAHLASVSRSWRKVLSDDTTYHRLVQKMNVRTRLDLTAEYASWHEYWDQSCRHASWRPSPVTRPVDFGLATIGIEIEGVLSQIYYTYPRFGLQFNRKFSLYAVDAVRDLTRIALKKGVHINKLPYVPPATFLAIGKVADDLVKLDFVTSADPATATETTRIVAWTVSGVELFQHHRLLRGEQFTSEEAQMKYSLCPLKARLMLQLESVAHDDVLIIHVNDKNVVAVLSCPGIVSYYDFDTGEFRHATTVPGPIQTTPDRGEWRSRERFEFKGSSSIGAIIDDDGIVHVYSFVAKQWLTIAGKYWPLRGELLGPTGPRPGYLRTAGDYVVFWNAPPHPSPPVVIEVYRIVVETVDGEYVLRKKQILCELYTSISSVHIDSHRCYVNVALQSKDVIIDVWDLYRARFVSRVYAINNEWSKEKENDLDTHLCRLFWSTHDTVVYYELNSRGRKGNSICLRQVSCLPLQQYESVCRSLVGKMNVNFEPYPVVSSRRLTVKLGKERSAASSSDPEVTDFPGRPI